MNRGGSFGSRPFFCHGFVVSVAASRPAYRSRFTRVDTPSLVTSRYEPSVAFFNVMLSPTATRTSPLFCDCDQTVPLSSVTMKPVAAHAQLHHRRRNDRERRHPLFLARFLAGPAFAGARLRNSGRWIFPRDRLRRHAAERHE